MLLNPIQARALLAHALDNGYAILAFNADSPAAITDGLLAAREVDAPIIIETSLWQLKGHSFGVGNAITGMARYMAQLAVLADSPAFRDIPVIYHTDHIKGPETLDILGAGIRGVPFQAGTGEILLHPSTISLDASDFTEEENIETISTLAAIAEEVGKPITLEMESEVDAGITPPDISRRLLGAVEARHPGVVYLWAPGLGTQHGLHDGGYPTFDPEVVRQNVDLVEEITGRRFGLALHGSSGLANHHLTQAAEAGVVKVNWSSESLDLRSKAAQEYYATHTAELTKGHPKWKNSAMDNGLQAFISARAIPVIAERMRIQRTAGQASAFMAELNAQVAG